MQDGDAPAHLRRMRLRILPFSGKETVKLQLLWRWSRR
jgi:hypothetical protein